MLIVLTVLALWLVALVLRKPFPMFRTPLWSVQTFAVTLPIVLQVGQCTDQSAAGV